MLLLLVPILASHPMHVFLKLHKCDVILAWFLHFRFNMFQVMNAKKSLMN